MLGQVNETEFDLRFSLFRIPIRVHPGFWIVSLLMGRGILNAENGLILMAIWVGVVFVSILVHEMGHALAVRYFRWEPHIVIYHFGGYAAYAPPWGQTHWQSIFISFAGPGAGFLLCGLTWGLGRLYFQSAPQINVYIVFAYLQLIYVNLWWGLMNLLPVLPLDGGQIAREVLHLLRLRRPMEWTFKTGILVAGAVAAYFLIQEEWYIGMLFAFLCVSNVQMLQQSGQTRW